MSILMYNSVTYGSFAIIPYPVDIGAKESIEFFTDTLVSYTAENEERAQMRAIPRHSIQYTYSLQYLLTMGVFNTSYSWLRNNWLIPFWTEAQRVSVTSGDSVFVADTLVHDLRIGGMLLLYSWDQKWQVLEITGVSPTTVTTSSAATFGGQIYLIPVRRGWLSGDIAFTPTGADNTAKMTFEIDDVLTGLGVTVPTQYNSYDLCTDPYEITDSSGDTTVTMQEDQVEYDFGNIAHRTPWLNPQYAKQYKFTGTGAWDIRGIKEFFYRRAGRFRGFMAPSFESNLRKTSTGDLTTLFKFKDDGYTSQVYSRKKFLGFQLDDGSWLMRKAIGFVDLGGGESQVTLDASLGVNAGRILMASYAGLNRLDTDVLQLSHQNAGYFTTSYQVLEISP